MLYLFLFLLPLLVSCQKTTEAPHHTVTYIPGQDCLPYDGSVVPDCSPRNPIVLRISRNFTVSPMTAAWSLTVLLVILSY